MSQNSIVLKTGSPLKSAFLTIFLNSTINQIQIKGNYSITKQKYLNQGKIEKLKILSYNKKYDSLLKIVICQKLKKLLYLLSLGATLWKL